MSTTILASKIPTASVPYVGAWQKIPHRNEVNGPAQRWAYEVLEEGTGTVTATVTIDVSLDGINPITPALDVVTMNNTAPTAYGNGFDVRWQWIRVSISAMSASSTVSVWLGW